MSEITDKLDEIADSLEKQGFSKEASQLDTVSNTIEAFTGTVTDRLPGDTRHGDMMSQGDARAKVMELTKELEKANNQHDKDRILQDITTLEKQHHLK